MAQITNDFISQVLKHCADKEHPPLTVWEAEQLALAWNDAQRYRWLRDTNEDPELYLNTAPEELDAAIDEAMKSHNA